MDSSSIIATPFPGPESLVVLAELSRLPDAEVPDDAIPALDEHGELLDAVMRQKRINNHAQRVYGSETTSWLLA